MSLSEVFQLFVKENSAHMCLYKREFMGWNLLTHMLWNPEVQFILKLNTSNDLTLGYIQMLSFSAAKGGILFAWQDGTLSKPRLFV